MAFESRILNRNDTALIEEFYLHYRTQTQLDMNVKLDLSPDIWKAMTVLGDKAKVLAVIDREKQQIACACITSLKKCFIQGKLYTIGYMSNLKARREYWGTSAFARFMRIFNEEWKRNGALCWLFSVFTSNSALHQMLAKPHELFSDIAIITSYHTHIFKCGALLSLTLPSHPYQVRMATQADIPLIQEYLIKESKTRDLLPDYSPADLQRGSGLLPDFALSKLAIAIRDNGIVGMLGTWDQSAYRRWFVESYSRKYRIMKPLINTLAPMLNMPVLPKSGGNISYHMLSLMLISQNDSQLFEILFHKVCENIPKNELISIGLIDQHPFSPFFRKKCISLRNYIYLGYKPEYAEIVKSIRKDRIYIEQGGL